MPRIMYKCENCGIEFEIEKHERAFVNHRIVIVCGTGKNMCYRGDTNREYAVCPHCGTTESQLSAECRAD
jgi:DNA-directed RNA polymerase subunit RPC12/RpoP